MFWTRGSPTGLFPHSDPSEAQRGRALPRERKGGKDRERGPADPDGPRGRSAHRAGGGPQPGTPITERGPRER